MHTYRRTLSCHYSHQFQNAAKTITITPFLIHSDQTFGPPVHLKGSYQISTTLFGYMINLNPPYSQQGFTVKYSLFPETFSSLRIQMPHPVFCSITVRSSSNQCSQSSALFSVNTAHLTCTGLNTTCSRAPG